MSTADPYITVRRRMLDDPRFNDDHEKRDRLVFGWWCELVIRADAAWPNAAYVPTDCSADVLERLAQGALVVRYPEGRYRMPEYDLEREGRGDRGAVGGRARARGAVREPGSGRFQSAPPANGSTGRTQRALVGNGGTRRATAGGERWSSEAQPPKKNVLDERDGADVPTRDVGTRSNRPSAAGRPDASPVVAPVATMFDDGDLDGGYPPSAWSTDP